MRFRLRVFLFLLTLGLASATPVQAVNFLWDVAAPGTGDFNDFSGTNWTPNAQTPVAGDWVYVNNGGTATITTDNTAAFDYLYLGRGASTSGWIEQSAGVLSIRGGLRGVGRDGGTGTYTMTGGMITMNTANITGTPLYMGAGAASYGTLTMSGDSVVDVNGIALIGDVGGQAYLAMQGAAVFNAQELTAGNNVGGVADIHVTDATMNLSTVARGYGYEGTLDLGRMSGTGTMRVDSFGVLNVAGRTNIGNGDNYNGIAARGDLTLADYATMTTSAGPMRNYGWTWGDGGDVYVGCAEWDNGANARIQTQRGGVGSLTIEDFASVNIPTGNWRVGIYGGTGTLTMTDSASGFVAYDLIVGIWSRQFSVGGAWEGEGTAVIGNGSDSPTLTTGGELRAGDSGHGTITLNSGFVNVGTHFRVGYNGYADSDGRFDMNGGNMNVAQWVQVGNNDGGANGAGIGGVFNMNGGTFTKNGLAGTYMLVGRGLTGTWNQNGGDTDIQTIACFGNRGYKGTLNLNGGTFQVGLIQIGYENDCDAVAEINFNGGVLKVGSGPYSVAANSYGFNTWITRYASKYVSLNVNAGGAVIDTSGVNPCIGGDTWGDIPLLHDAALGATPDGGLTVIGGGILDLTGVNTYNGPTDVTAGGLGVRRGGSIATTAITLAAGTSLAVDRNATNNVVVGVLDSLNLGAGTTVKVSVPTTNAAPLFNVTGTGGVLTLPTGSDVVNVPIIPAGATIATGVWYDLFAADSIAAGDATNVALTSTLNATLTTQVAGTNVQFKITDLVVKDVTWTGSTSGDWTVGGDTNWVGTGGSTPEAYYDLYTVRFTDAVVPTSGTATLNTEVHLGGTIIASGATDYTVSGTGSIAGPIGLTKTGSGTFTISTPNLFTGNVSITGGGVVAGAKSALGMSNDVTVDGAGTTLVTNADFGGQWSSRNLTVTNGAAVTVNGQYVSGYGVGDVATTTVTNSTLSVTGGARFGYRGASSTFNLVNSTYNMGAHVTVADTERFGTSTSVMNMDNSTVTGVGNANFHIGLYEGANGTLNMVNNSHINMTGGAMFIGYSSGYNGAPAPYSGSTGTVNMYDTSGYSNPTGGLNGYGESGTLNMYANTTVNCAYLQIAEQNISALLTINLKDNAKVTLSDYARIAYWGGITGTVDRLVIDGSAANPGVNNFTVGTIFYVGWQWGSATPEIGDNAVTVTGANANVNVAGQIVLGAQAGQGAWNQNGGVTTSVGTVVLGQYDWQVWQDASSTGGGLGILNLNGGEFKAPQFSTDSGTILYAADNNYVWGGSASGVVNFNGGMLTLTGADVVPNLFATTGISAPLTPAPSVTLNVMGGGAMINVADAAKDVKILQPLLNGTGGGADGGLTKAGAGTLRLAGVSSYNGNTTLNAGKIVLAVDEAIPSGAGKGNFSGLAGTTLDLNSHNQTLNNPSGAFTTTNSSGVDPTLTANVTSATPVAYSGKIEDGASPVAVTKTGSGKWVVSGPNTNTGKTTLEAGTLELATAAQSTVLSLGGVDIKAGLLSLAYTTPGDNPSTTVDALMKASYDGGAWDVGQFQSSTAAVAGLTLGWFDTGTTVDVKLAVVGDATLDGTVNFDDLNLVLGNYGTTDAIWAQGDVNYDGLINFDDLNFVLGNYGQSLPPEFAGLSGAGSQGVGSGAGSSIPEPGTLALLAAGLIGLIAYAWRKRK